jgi:myo-inositol-1(or 4)-monophosphatase
MTAPAETGSLPPSPAQLESMAIEVVTLAAHYVAEQAGAARVAGTKSSPTDLVTDTDLAAEKLIRRELEQRCPGSSVVGEELDDTDGVSSVGWVIDPIDGTVNFAYDLPVFSVSLAATVDGQTVAGAVADVMRGEVFSATVGAGARRDGQPITPSSADDPAQSLVLTGFSYDATIRAEEAAVLNRLLPAVRDIRCMGSAALNLCWVGCGRGEAFFERDLKPYDWAAGALVAREAGAVVRLPTVEGIVVSGAEHGADDLVVAAAPGIHHDLAALLELS